MGYVWYHQRYKPNAFVQDQKGTCRICDKPIYFCFETGWYDKTKRTIGVWLHEGFTDETFQDQDHYPQPKEFCVESVTAKDHDQCGGVVKFEDQRSGNYACGRHMRKWEEEAKYRRQAEEAKVRREAREALEAFEAEQYDIAAAWIKENFPQLIAPDWRAKEPFSRIKRTTNVDVFVLKDFLEGIVEKLAAPEEEDTATEEGLAYITNRPPPPWKGYDPEEAM